jgi:hypothetical protein
VVGVHIVQPITEDLFANLSVAKREALHGRCAHGAPIKEGYLSRSVTSVTALTRAKCARGGVPPRAPLRPLPPNSK